jgi:hypothetical protein
MVHRGLLDLFDGTHVHATMEETPCVLNGEIRLTGKDRRQESPVVAAPEH